MRVWPIFKKEIRLYFTSLVAWAILFVFAALMGVFFWLQFTGYAEASMRSAMNPTMAPRELNLIDYVMRPLFFNTLSVILFLFLMPLITMRLFAEERRSGTLELLMTYPVRDGAVLTGKFLAALVLYFAMLGITLVYVGIMAWFVRLEWAPVLILYLGLILMGSAFLAIGTAASSLTENQIVAALITGLILLVLWIAGWFAEPVGGWAARILTHLSVPEHMESFAKGVLDTKDVIYFLDLTIFGVFVTLVSLQARRWNG
jgi:ABC-2 type transport system permease protein